MGLEKNKVLRNYDKLGDIKILFPDELSYKDIRRFSDF